MTPETMETRSASQQTPDPADQITKVITMRLPLSEVRRIKQAVAKINVGKAEQVDQADQDDSGKPLSMNKFCRDAIMENVSAIEANFEE